MNTRLHYSISLTALMILSLLFACSTTKITVHKPLLQAENTRRLPILNGPAAYFDRGYGLYYENEPKIALEYFQKAVELAPANARYHLFAGLVKYKLYGFQAAELDIETALSLNQDLSGYKGVIRNYYKDYGVYCLNIGLTGKSISCFNKVVALLPDDAEVRQYLAAVYLELAKECTKGYCPVMDNHDTYSKVFGTLLD